MRAPRPFSRPAALLAVPVLAIIAIAAIALIASPLTRQALVNSAILAAGATAIAWPLGTLLAVLMTRYELPSQRLAMAGLGVLLLLPLYVQLSGWDAALGKLGWHSLAYGSLAEPLLAGMRGAIFVHGMAAVPWVALIVGIGVVQVDPAPEEAALLRGPPSFVLRRVTLPAAAPFLAAAALWAIVSTTSDMTVTNIFLVSPGERTYTEQFYMTFALSADPGEATLAALPGIASLGLLIVAALVFTHRWIGHSLHHRPQRQVKFAAGRWRPLLTAVLWLAIATLLAVPLASLIVKAGFVVEQIDGVRRPGWSAQAAIRETFLAPWRFGQEFAGTIVVALGAATLATAIALPLGWFARRGGARAVPVTVVIALGLVLPGPLVGVALIWLLNHEVAPAIPLMDGTTKSWLLVLYDQTPLAPIVAQAVRALPLATVLVWHSFRTLDPDVLAAGALSGATPWNVFRRIALPQRWPGIAAAWILAFAVAAGDLAWAHLVTPPGLDLIQRRVFGLVHSGVEEQVAAISLINVLVYALVLFAIVCLLQPRSTRRERGPKVSSIR